MRHGLLLINLGTPNSPALGDVKGYLREFLTDGRVVSLTPILRYLLVYGYIVPFRAKKSAHAYQQIWTEDGSPLLVHSLQFIDKLKNQVGNQYQIALGMRYGNPSISSALNQLKDCDHITMLPLFPQYSSAATGSSITEALRLLSSWEVFPSLTIIRDFFQEPAYIKAQAQIIAAHLSNAEYLLFSYHGLPEHQIEQSGCQSICSNTCPDITALNKACYKAQCHKTSALLAQSLHLSPTQFGTAFQSRIGKTPWIKPFTDEILVQLAAQGIKKIAIACPSFVTDCLETLEEIGIRAKQQWQELGGEEFTLIPCLNDSPSWINALIQMVSAPHLQNE